MLENRFHVLQKVSQGSFGTVYQVSDNKHPMENLVIKIQQDKKCFDREEEFLGECTRQLYLDYDKHVLQYKFDALVPQQFIHK